MVLTGQAPVCWQSWVAFLNAKGKPVPGFLRFQPPAVFVFAFFLCLQSQQGSVFPFLSLLMCFCLSSASKALTTYTPRLPVASLFSGWSVSQLDSPLLWRKPSPEVGRARGSRHLGKQWFRFSWDRQWHCKATRGLQISKTKPLSEESAKI